jgi:hypothetical protein
MTGTTFDDFDYIIWSNIIFDYKKLGDNMEWEMKNKKSIKIKNMETSHVKNCINMMSGKEQNGTRKAWIVIFEDVLQKRRTNKINKIKTNIKNKIKL